MKISTKIRNTLKSPIGAASVGVIVGGVVLGNLLVNRQRVSNVPVVGPALDNASSGFAGSSLSRRFF